MTTVLISYPVLAFLLLVLNATVSARAAAYAGDAQGTSDVCPGSEMVAAQGEQLLQMESSLRRTAVDGISSLAAAAALPRQPPGQAVSIQAAVVQDHRSDDKAHPTLPLSLLASSLAPISSTLNAAKTVGADVELPVSLLASAVDSASKPSRKFSKMVAGAKAATAKKDAQKSAARKAAPAKAAASKAKASKGAASKATASKAAASSTRSKSAASEKDDAPSAAKGATKKTGEKKAASKEKASAKKTTDSKEAKSKGKETKANKEEKAGRSKVLNNLKKGKKLVSTGATRQHAEPAVSKVKGSKSKVHAKGAKSGVKGTELRAKETAKGKKAKKLTLTKTSKAHGKLKAASVKSKKKKSKEELEEDAEDEAKDETTGTLYNPVIGSVVVLMSAPAGMLLLAFGAFLWVRSQDDVEMGA